MDGASCWVPDRLELRVLAALCRALLADVAKAKAEDEIAEEELDSPPFADESSS